MLTPDDTQNIKAQLREIYGPLKAPRPKREQFVYFIECAGLIKIGVSVNPETRLASIQTANGHTARLLATVPGGTRLERQLHEKFKASRVGGEWFKPTNEIREYLREISPEQTA